MILDRSSRAANVNEEIPALIETLLTTEQRLEELTAGEVDTVAGLDGRTFVLRRAQDQLRHSEATRQADILNALPAHLALLDTEGNIISVNEAWRRFAVANLLSSGHGVGLNYLAICDQARGDHSSEADQVAAGVRAVLDGSAKSFSIEYPCHAPTEDRWFLLTVTPLAGDRPNGAVVMHLNITERLRAEEALRDSATKFRSVAQSATDAIIATDSAGHIISWNNGAHSIFGYSESEILGSSLSRLMPEVYRTAHEREIARRVDPGEIGNIVESIGFRQDGSQFPLEVSLNTWMNGKEKFYCGFIRDITSRKRIEVELEQARDTALESVRLKSEFLANMSHEIRTPMNGVIGMTGLLLETNLSPEQRENAETIQSSADALLTILDDILDFSKIEAGLLRFEKIDFELRSSVEASVELLCQRAQAKGLELASHVHQDVPTALQGDPGRLRQVLMNLIGNAVKFTDRGEVTVSVRNISETTLHAMLRFEIKDTGIGISQEAQRKLFRAFTQADGSTSRKYGGTGLGLAISKQLVELMSGEIGIESVPGQGSTFWFTGRFEKQPTAVITVSELDNNLSGVRVLIVDHNSTNRNILNQQTSSWGMIVTEAKSGECAIEFLRSGVAAGKPYKIAVLDLALPDIDGFQLAEAIESDPLIASVALVLLPSVGKRGHAERAREVGIAAYLPKPVRQSQLYNCLTAVMAKADFPSEGSLTQLVTRHSLRDYEVQQNEKTFSSVRIIVAEDNLTNQKVALGQLNLLGYRARAVANGLELLDALEKEPVDIILMDCQMPEMDGFAATDEIRRREGKDRHTTIVAMTANALEGDEKICLAAGMDDYISKPVKSAILRSKLERWTKPNEGKKSNKQR
jgi:PAS domain S-box-containing protein